MSLAQILIVDDDLELVDMVSRYLTDNGFCAAAVSDGVAMDAWLAVNHADLVVLDVMLPGEDGLSIVKRIKAHSDIPVLMLSARSSDIDRILGLEMGADDYLPKPFHPRELLARIHARLRKQVEARPVEMLEVGVFRLDLARRIAYQQGQRLSLSTADFSLLRILLQNSHRVLSRNQLVDMAQGAERMPFDRSIDVRVARLRRKIETDARSPKLIKTVWGGGYVFTAPVEKT